MVTSLVKYLDQSCPYSVSQAFTGGGRGSLTADNGDGSPRRAVGSLGSHVFIDCRPGPTDCSACEKDPVLTRQSVG